MSNRSDIAASVEAEARDKASWTEQDRNPALPDDMTHACDRCGIPLTAKCPYALCWDCQKLPCHHGNKHSECDACFAESDRAFDENREMHT